MDIRQENTFRRQTEQDEDIYARLSDRLPVETDELASATPRRQEFVALWKYLSANAQDSILEDALEALARKTARSANLPCSVLRTRICLDVFEELGLLTTVHHTRSLEIHLRQGGQKVDLESSRILKHLRRNQAGDKTHG